MEIGSNRFVAATARILYNNLRKGIEYVQNRDLKEKLIERLLLFEGEIFNCYYSESVFIRLGVEGKIIVYREWNWLMKYSRR